MRKILENEYLNLIARIFLGGFFVFAAIGKIADPIGFAKEIGNYNILPDFLINFVALTLPWIEISAGVLLILGLRLKASSVIIGLMLVVFIIAVGSAMARGLNINCGCFSNKITYVGWGKILENTGLLLLSVYLFFFPVKKWQIR